MMVMHVMTMSACYSAGPALSNVPAISPVDFSSEVTLCSKPSNVSPTCDPCTRKTELDAPQSVRARPAQRDFG
jgi:hypothetical protein